LVGIVCFAWVAVVCFVLSVLQLGVFELRHGSLDCAWLFKPYPHTYTHTHTHTHTHTQQTHHCNHRWRLISISPCVLSCVCLRVYVLFVDGCVCVFGCSKALESEIPKHFAARKQNTVYLSWFQSQTPRFFVYFELFLYDEVKKLLCGKQIEV
jgi:hypothetical protein